MKVLVTGGAGFIGSHTTIELIAQKHDVLIIDNFSNSSLEVIRRIEKISKKTCEFLNMDIRETSKLIAVFEKFVPDCVIHFAGLKSVGDSIIFPLDYYDNNFLGSLSLLKAMDASGCKKIIYSSSATVYGEPKYVPLDEKHPCEPVNPYGKTKLFVEEMLKDWATSKDKNSAIILRYFNPVGAHSSGLLGEDPLGVPNNLMPIIADVAIGKLPHINIYGNDYSTRDGTGERDYVHVVDLAQAHVAAVKKVSQRDFDVFNIGTGSGTTVLELIEEFKKASGKKISTNFVNRRMGDVAISIASVEKAKDELSWSAVKDIKDMSSDAWRWKIQNMTE